MKIGNIVLKNNLILAPMAGITDVGFRHTCKKMGVGLTVTEMVSAASLFYIIKSDEELETSITKKHGTKYNHRFATLSLLETEGIESPVSVQLFGNNPEIFAKVVKSDYIKKFDIIDLNMGCPAPKIVKNKEGSWLLKEFKQNPTNSVAEKIIRTCVKNSNKPITVKFRIGFNAQDNIATAFAKMCESSGASAITLHARTTASGYSGTADWDIIKEVKAAVSIPVIANGDVKNLADYKTILKLTNADGVMIGRASFGNPWIFKEILHGSIKITNKERYEILKEQIEVLKKHGIFKFKEVLKHFLAIVSGEKNASEVRKAFLECNNEVELLEVLKTN